MEPKTRVLFLQSSGDYWSVTMIHRLLMQYYDRDRFEVHVACHPGTRAEPSASLKAIETISTIYLHQTNFGPTLYGKPKKELAHLLLKEGLPILVSQAELARYVSRQAIDIIHTAQMPRDALCGLALARLTGAKCIIHTHMKFGPWLGAFVPWVMKRADGIIACSHFVANSTITAGRCASDKVYPILNSLDTGLWDADTDGSKVRQEFGIAPDVPLLASIAFHAPRKGTAQLLQALALLKRRLPAFKLLVVGESIPWGHRGQHRYTDYLQALTHELGLDEHVIFTGYRSDVRQILAACDLYTMPSDGEPCAVVFLEAMAMKKPVVALANGGTPEIVEHGTAGLLAPPGNIPRLAEHIQTLIDDPALRQRMGACGRQRVEQCFNPQLMARQVEQVYQRVLHKQPHLQAAALATAVPPLGEDRG